MPKINYRRKTKLRSGPSPAILGKGHAHGGAKDEMPELCHYCRGEGCDQFGNDCGYCGGDGIHRE